MYTLHDKNANPYIKRMHRKLSMPKPRQRGQNLARVDRKAAVQTRAKLQGAIWEDIQKHWAYEEDLAQTLAKKHNKDVKWMRLELNRSAHYGQSRKVSPYNAWVHAKALKINEGLPVGQKTQLLDLHKLAKETSSYRDVPKEQLEEMMHCVEEKRLIEKKGIRSRPVAHVRDVRATVQHVGKELGNLRARCSTSSLAITVHTESTQSNNPISYHDDVSRDFIELLFGLDFDEFALKYEAFALFQVRGLTKNHNEYKTMSKGIVCRLVRRGLRDITGNPSIDMEWKRYDTKIVAAYQVELVGWPVAVFDPHVLSLKDLETCTAALRGINPTCYWRKMTSEEVDMYQEARAAKQVSGEIVPKQRKRRSDAGKKRGPYAKTKAKTGNGKRVRDEDMDGESDDSDKENASSKRKQHRSASVIADSD